MPEYRRNWVPGGTFFFTVVTAARSPIFRDPDAVALLGHCFRRARRDRPFRVEAIVVLPDHLHTIWGLPDGDADFATRWAAIKGDFTRCWLARGEPEQAVSPGRSREQRRGVWQARFIEHTIRDEDDLIHHVEYIHFNPVKHGHVRCPRDWPWSSFHRYVRIGRYPADWACSEGLSVPGFGRVDVGLIE